MNYKEVQTKREYRDLLYSLRIESKKLSERFPTILIYKSIYDQISDIINNLDNNIVFSDEQIYSRYSIGAIAVKNFDCDNEIFGRKLQDAFGTLFEYWNLPEI